MQVEKDHTKLQKKLLMEKAQIIDAFQANFLYGTGQNVDKGIMDMQTSVFAKYVMVTQFNFIS